MIQRDSAGLPIICAWEGCNNPVDRGDSKKPVRYCKDEKCIDARDSARRNRWYSKNSEKVQAAARDKIKAKREAKLKANPKSIVEENQVPKIDRRRYFAQDRQSHADRGSEKGFKRYMTENPHYFAFAFPRVTVDQAWVQVSGGRIWPPEVRV